MRFIFINRFILLFVVFACKTGAFAQIQKPHELTLQLSFTERTDLESYFRVMLTDSEGGYVLFGVKPVCCEGAYIAFPCSSFNIFQQHHSARLDRIDRGHEALQRLGIDWLDTPISIVKYDQEDYFVPDYKGIEWINNKALLDTINQSLPLFQITLGPTITAEGLLNEIRSPSGTFAEALANHKVLIGITLGFGTHNSLLQSRLEYIDEGMYQPEVMPLAPRTLRYGLASPLQQMGMNSFRSASLARIACEITPNAAYASFAEEATTIRKRLSNTAKIHPNLHPPLPTFAIDLQHPESKELLARYVQAQKKIHKLLDSPHFLEDVLSLITGKEVNITPSNKEILVTSNLEDSETILPIVTASVRSNFLEKDEEYLSSAVLGIRAADKEIETRTKQPVAVKEQTAPIVAYIQAKAQVEAAENLQASEKALSAIAQQDTFVELVPQKVFYKVTEHGQGPRLSAAHTNAIISYTISPLIAVKDDYISTPNKMEQLRFKDLIPGLSLALNGMRTGEVREVYVHPDYAYGTQANFTPALALKVRVRLDSLPDASAAPNEPLSYAPVDDCQKSLKQVPTPEKMSELKRAAAFAEGYNAWLFYGRLAQLHPVDRFIDSLSLQKLTAGETDQGNKQLLKDVQSKILQELFPAPNS